MKHLYLWTALAIAIPAVVIVLFRIGSPPYYPKVIAEFPGNITMTIIDQPWDSSEKCAKENTVIATKIRSKCPNCSIKASCPTKLDAMETRAFHGQAVNLPLVYSESEIILIKAEARLAMQVCSGMAKQITKQKIQPARCIKPVSAH